jgi:hypothetical protein
MFAAAGAAALTALAVTVAAPAIGDSDPTGPDDFVSCLRAHGLDDAPSGGIAFKMWLKERMERGDETATRAVEACTPEKRVAAAPAEEELRSCLEEHGAQIEGDDAVAIKRWIAAHEDDPAAREAMEACKLAAKPGGSPCGDQGVDAAPGTPATEN